MAYSWENRINFVIRYLYDIDGNGSLEQKDFMCLALRATIVEGKGEFNQAKFQEKQHVMMSLWEEISDLADFDKDGVITNEEFKKAVQKCCAGKKFADFPQSMRMFIDANFKMMDINDDGLIANEEYRYGFCTQFAVEDIAVVDEAYNKLINDEDRRKGGLTLSRYQELYAEFLGNPNDNPAVYLFGPLAEICIPGSS